LNANQTMSFLPLCGFRSGANSAKAHPWVGFQGTRDGGLRFSYSTQPVFEVTRRRTMGDAQVLRQAAQTQVFNSLLGNDLSRAADAERPRSLRPASPRPVWHVLFKPPLNRSNIVMPIECSSCWMQRLSVDGVSNSAWAARRQLP
jgi:hypothetical protein